MPDNTILIEVPEKIVFQHTIAALTARVGAYTLDLLIQGAIIIAFVLLFFATGLISDMSQLGDSYSQDVTTFFLLLLFFLQWGYSLFFETIMNGQTPGKKAAKIRVIKRNGEALDFPTLVLRNLLRGIDTLPFPFIMLLGGCIAAFDKKNRRVGDIIAGTLVVYNSRPKITEPSFFVSIGKGEREDLISGKRLSERDLYVIRNFFNNSALLSPQKESELGKKLAARVCQKLELPIPREGDETEKLKRIYRAHTIDENN